MKALILAAGYATRLYPITNHKPKSLLTIKGKPIIEYIINKILQIKTLDEILIITNHHYIKEFERWLRDYPCILPIRLIDDGSISVQDKLGSIGDMAFAIKEKQIKDDLLVVGGDNLFSFTLNKFVDFATSGKNSVFIGAYNLNGKMQANKFGVLKLNEQGQVIDFQEKPSSGNGSSLVSMCLYLFPSEKIPLIYEYLNHKDNHDQAGNYISWLSKRDSVYGYTFNDGSWLDIGDIDAYTEAVFTF
ncbi:nucleotidyltransferase family protein [Candidatus Omnitrophota bacterium]